MVEYRHGQVVDGHLGGYVEGGDPNTTYPAMWEWLAETYANLGPMLDVGCGDGATLAYFRTLGVDGVGVDGIAQHEERILQHDFTKGPWPTPGSWFGSVEFLGFGLVWSCEFVEHVAEEYVENFLSAFLLGRLVLMTHALPGQGGHHHVNCQTAAYWIRKLASISYALDVPLTARLRALAAQEDIPAEGNYFARTGLAFVPASGPILAPDDGIDDRIASLVDRPYVTSEPKTISISRDSTT